MLKKISITILLTACIFTGANASDSDKEPDPTDVKVRRLAEEQETLLKYTPVVTSEVELIADLESLRDEADSNGQGHIEILDVAGCGLLSDEFINRLPQICPRLIELNVRDCRNLTQRNLMDYGKANRTLKRLFTNLWTIDRDIIKKLENK